MPHVAPEAPGRVLARQHEALDTRRIHVVHAVKQRHGREPPVHAAHTQMLRSDVLKCLCLLHVARARACAALSPLSDANTTRGRCVGMTYPV